MSDDIHALSGAYAVDALDDIERAQFERHLAQCPACQHEVASLREASALMAETTVGVPSPQLRDRVLAEIATVRPLPPVVPAAVPHRRRRAAAFLVAAAAVVAIGTGGVVVHSMNDDKAPSTVADRVIGASDHETYTQHLGHGATATLYRSKKYDRAVLVTKGMPAAPSGHEYVVWLLQGTSMVRAAVMPDGADNTVVLTGDAATANGAGITVEDAGTSPTTPSSDLVTTYAFTST